MRSSFLVIPAKAGIQADGLRVVHLDPRFRGGDVPTAGTP
jgi:hypothetical protein